MVRWMEGQAINLARLTEAGDAGVAPTDAVLKYAPRDSRWMLRRNHVVFALVVALAWLVWQVGGRAWKRVEVAYWSRACCEYAVPADRVVFEQDDVQIATLMSTGIRYQKMTWREQADPEYIWHTPAPYVHVPQSGWEPRVAFMHRLRAAGGKDRLVVIELNPMREPGNFRQGVFFYPRVFASGALQAGKEIRRYDDSGRISMADEERLTVYAGQVDPGNPARFTIDCAVSGRRGTLEGELLADDIVKLNVRSGDALSKHWKPIDPVIEDPWVR